jgi:hypothetical protein
VFISNSRRCNSVYTHWHRHRAAIMLPVEACSGLSGNQTLWHFTGRSYHCDLGDTGTIGKHTHTHIHLFIHSLINQHTILQRIRIVVNGIMIAECVPFLLYFFTKQSVCQPRARSSSLLLYHAIIFSACTIAWCIAQIINPLRW